MTKASSPVSGKNIVLGVSGGIAAYKAADLASKLAASGVKVYTVMTENACRLIQPKTFEALTGLPVFTTMWTEPQDFKIKHVDLAITADLFVAAPATADVIAKFATGICDDILTTTFCAAWRKPILIAPAMNDNMWTNPIVQRNVKALTDMGCRFIGPETGRLACGTEGAIGRMSEPADILKQIEQMATNH